MKSEIQAAIVAHRIWKERLSTAIELGKSEFLPEIVKTDNNCAFGKWFYNISIEDKKTEYYQSVKEFHAKFHQEAGKILDLALAGKKEEAKKAMEVGSEYSKISSKLIMLLNIWEKSLN